MSLRLEEFSDRELLFAIEDHSDEDGTVSSAELADGLGLSGLKNPRQNIAIRLSWLKRYGVVARDPQTKRWNLTYVGAQLVRGGLTAEQRTALTSDLSDERYYALMVEMTRVASDIGDEASIMIQRQWRFAQAERKRSRTNGKV